MKIGRLDLFVNYKYIYGVYCRQACIQVRSASIYYVSDTSGGEKMSKTQVLLLYFHSVGKFQGKTIF